MFLAFNCCGHGAASVRPTFAERFLDYYFPVDKEPPPPKPEEELEDMEVRFKYSQYLYLIDIFICI